MSDPWFDTKDENLKEMRRKAADQFLQAIVQDPTGLRKRVLMTPTSDGTGKSELNKYYESIAGIPIPDSVRVICLEPDLLERGKLVVFILPTVSSTDPSAPAINPIWQDAWSAAWPPY